MLASLEARGEFGAFFASFENFYGAWKSNKQKRNKERQNLRRIVNTGAQAATSTAWAVGQSLRYVSLEHKTGSMVGASGLLALYWWGHLDHFVGVIASIDRRAMRPYAEQFRSMLRCIDTTTFVSPFDALRLPSMDEIFTGGATAERLEAIAETFGLRKKLAPFVALHQAAELNHRFASMRTWQIPEPLDAALCLAWKSWSEVADTNAKAAAFMARRPPLLLDAYTLSLHGSSLRSSETGVIGQLVAWSHAIESPDADRNLAMFLDVEVDSPDDLDAATKEDVNARLSGIRFRDDV